MELNPNKPAGAAPAPASSKGSEEAYHKEQLQEACQQFESLFLTQILSSMRKTGFKSNLFGNDQEGDMWKSMLDQQRADIWAKQGGVGLANLLYQQLKGQL